MRRRRGIDSGYDVNHAANYDIITRRDDIAIFVLGTKHNERVGDRHRR
jgi:hypothetical protein